MGGYRIRYRDRDYQLAGTELFIGRSSACVLRLCDGLVSRRHARVFVQDGAVWVEDLGSSNGTWFNKARIKRRKVEDGDEYYICSEKIKLVMR